MKKKWKSDHRSYTFGPPPSFGLIIPSLPVFMYKCDVIENPLETLDICCVYEKLNKKLYMYVM